MTAMTSKERVMTSLNWQEPDRVPVQTYLTPEIQQQLTDHFGGRDVFECLGVDLRGVHPVYKGKAKEPYGPYFFDYWGVGYELVDNHAGGLYPEARLLPLAELYTMDDVRNYAWPNPDDFDYSHFAEQCEQFKDFAIFTSDASVPDIVNGVSRGRGMERVMVDVLVQDEVGMAIIDKRCDILHEVYRRALEAAQGKINILCLGEDMGNQRGRMVSPEVFEAVFRPRLQRFIDLAHHYGAKAMMHSCGDTHEIQPTLIEMGLDVLDAMQPEPAGMDPETIRRQCKGRLAFCGLISTQDTLPFRSVEACRAEARHRLDVIAGGGGYIFSPAHCIQANTPLENVLAIYEEALGTKL